MSRRRPARPGILWRARPPWPVTALIAVGAALLVLSGVIHLHLYAGGYDEIPTIGDLFLAQAVSAFVIATALVATRGLAALVAGIGLAAGTIAGFLVSVQVGLFGFSDSFQAADASLALADECAVAALLLVAAGMLLGRRRGGPGREVRGQK